MIPNHILPGDVLAGLMAHREIRPRDRTPLFRSMRAIIDFNDIPAGEEAQFLRTYCYADDDIEAFLAWRAGK
ncbi:MAG: hypothetical protein RIS45_1566 [Planctomycetota bacterium]|jgi:hypothetical protein